MRGSISVSLAVLLLLYAASGVAEPRPASEVGPALVSPGQPREFSQVSGPCPTFNWSAAPGAGLYELVVFRLPVGYGGDPLGEEPVLRATLPGGATGWTPSLERCLEPDTAYAWSVRSIGGGEVSEWAAPNLFRIALAPSRDELEQALDVVLRYRRSQDSRSRENREALVSNDRVIRSDAGGGEGASGKASAGLLVTEAESPVTGGTSFDWPILTRFLPGTDFVARQGESLWNDRTEHVFGGTCIFPAAGSGGTVSEYRTGVELPDGARIKRVVFFGEDSDPASDILIRLNRTQVTTPAVVPGSGTLQDSLIASFTTSGFSGVVAVASPDDLAELAGKVPGTSGGGVGHRFHDLYVELRNAAGFLHKLCGVEIEYQIPVRKCPLVVCEM